MKKRHLVAACIAAVAACAALAQSNVYRWVDKDGKVHFSDSPPPADARESSQKTMGGGYVSRDYPYAVQQAMKKNPVTLYTAPSCGDPCNSGRQLLSDRGIPFSERVAEGNPAVQADLKKLVGGLEVPVLVVGESPIKGYDSGQWALALDDAGYPRTRLPGQGPTRGAPESPTPTSAVKPPTAQ
jgi:glutaredoxin